MALVNHGARIRPNVAMARIGFNELNSLPRSLSFVNWASEWRPGMGLKEHEDIYGGWQEAGSKTLYLTFFPHYFHCIGRWRLRQSNFARMQMIIMIFANSHSPQWRKFRSEIQYCNLTSRLRCVILANYHMRWGGVPWYWLVSLTRWSLVIILIQGPT